MLIMFDKPNELLWDRKDRCWKICKETPNKIDPLRQCRHFSNHAKLSAQPRLTRTMCIIMIGMKLHTNFCHNFSVVRISSFVRYFLNDCAAKCNRLLRRKNNRLDWGFSWSTLSNNCQLEIGKNEMKHEFYDTHVS
jgi:hypothetical protein